MKKCRKNTTKKESVKITNREFELIITKRKIQQEKDLTCDVIEIEQSVLNKKGEVIKTHKVDTLSYNDFIEDLITNSYEEESKFKCNDISELLTLKSIKNYLDLIKDDYLVQIKEVDIYNNGEFKREDRITIDINIHYYINEAVERSYDKGRKRIKSIEHLKKNISEIMYN